MPISETLYSSKSAKYTRKPWILDQIYFCELGQNFRTLEQPILRKKEERLKGTLFSACKAKGKIKHSGFEIKLNVFWFQFCLFIKIALTLFLKVTCGPCLGKGKRFSRWLTGRCGLSFLKLNHIPLGTYPPPCDHLRDFHAEPALLHDGVALRQGFI